MFGITGTGFNVAKRLTNDGKVGSLVEIVDKMRSGWLTCAPVRIASSIQLGPLGSDDDVSRRTIDRVVERADGESRPQAASSTGPS